MPSDVNLKTIGITLESNADKVTSGVENVAESMKKGAKASNDFSIGMERVQKAMSARQSNEAAKSIEEVGKSANEATKELSKFEKARERVKAAGDKRNEDIKAIQQAFGKPDFSNEKIAKAMSKRQAFAEKDTEEFKRIREAIASGDLKNVGGLNYQWADGVKAASADLEEFASKLSNLSGKNVLPSDISEYSVDTIRKMIAEFEKLNQLKETGEMRGELFPTLKNDLQDATRNVDELSNRIKELTGVDVSSATLSQFSMDSVKSFVRELEKVDIQNKKAQLEDIFNTISNRGSKAEQDMAKVVVRFNELTGKNLSVNDLKGYSLESLKAVTKELEKGDVKRQSTELKAMFEIIDKGAKTAIEELDELAKKLSALTGKEVSTDAIRGFSTNSIKAVVKELEGNKIAKEKENLRDLFQVASEGPRKSISSTQAYKKTMDALKKALQGVWNVGLKATKTLGDITLAGLNKATQGIRNFIKGYEDLKKRIGSIFLRRVITSALKAIYNSLKEGVENMYQFGLIARQSFSTAMDDIATSSMYLKNSLGAMLAPAIEALAPIIDFIVDKFVSLLNVINQVISLLGGQGYWTKAIKQPQKYGEAVSNAAGNSGKAAKKAADDIKNWLAPWDELHLTPTDKDTTSPSGSGGGGGGGKAVADYSTMFENVAFDTNLKDLIGKGDWFGVGSLFAEKLNTITQEADNWIKQKFDPWASTFTGNIAKTINGFVSKYNWTLLGKTFADGFNAIIRAAKTWWETTNFLALGTAIGTAINSWFDNIDWQLLSSYFVEKTNGIIDFFSTSVATIFGGNRVSEIATKITNAITEYFKKVKWDKLGTTLKTFFNGLVDGITTFAEDGEMWRSIKTGMEKLFDKLKDLDTAKLGSSLSTIFTNAMGVIDWETIGTKIGEFLGGMDWYSITTTVLNAGWSLILGAIKGFFSQEHGQEAALAIISALSAKIALQNLVMNFTASVGAVKRATGSTSLTSIIATIFGISTSSVLITAAGIAITLALVVEGVKDKEWLDKLGKANSEKGGYNSDVGQTGFQTVDEAQKKEEETYKAWEKAVYDGKVKIPLEITKPSEQQLKVIADELNNSLKKQKVNKIFTVDPETGEVVEKKLNGANGTMSKVKNPKKTVTIDAPTEKNTNDVFAAIEKALSKKKLTKKFTIDPETGELIEEKLDRTISKIKSPKKTLEVGSPTQDSVNKTVASTNDAVKKAGKIEKTINTVKETQADTNKNVTGLQGQVDAWNGNKALLKGIATFNQDQKYTNSTVTALQGQVDKALGGKALLKGIATFNQDQKYTNNTVNALQGQVNAALGGKALLKGIATYNQEQKYTNSTVSALQGQVNAANGGQPLSKGVNTYAVNNVADTIQTLKNYVAQHGNIGIGTQLVARTDRLNANGGVYKNGKWHDVTMAASGGYFNQGQMFIAREAGPELVGTIGGNTAVMNNNQIVSSVAAGVAQAVASVLGNGQQNQSISLYLDGEVIYNSVVDRNNNHVARTGVSELIY